MAKKSSFTFAPGSKSANRLNKCDCGARKLAREKRCIACQIKRKAEVGGEQSVTDCNKLNEREMVERFMEGIGE